MSEYSLLGMESLVQQMKEHKQHFVDKVMPNLKGDDLTYARIMFGYVSDYIKSIETKITNAKLNTKIEL